MLIVFQRGISRLPNSMVSTTRRMEGSGGKMNSFWAMYSLRISFWMVPASRLRGTPRFSAGAVDIAPMGAAAGLAGREQVLEAGVGLLGAAEAREHAHRPLAAAIAGGMDAAREGVLARPA